MDGLVRLCQVLRSTSHAALEGAMGSHGTTTAGDAVRQAARHGVGSDDHSAGQGPSDDPRPAR